MPGSYPAEAVIGKPGVARGTSAHEQAALPTALQQSGGRTGQHSSQPLTNPPAGIPRVAAISCVRRLEVPAAPLFDAPLPDLSSDISGQSMDEKRKYPRTEINEPGYVSSGGPSCTAWCSISRPKGRRSKSRTRPLFRKRFLLVMANEPSIVHECRIAWIQAEADRADVPGQGVGSFNFDAFSLREPHPLRSKRFIASTTASACPRIPRTTARLKPFTVDEEGRVDRP